jgi:hypothetical protein
MPEGTAWPGPAIGAQIPFDLRVLAHHWRNPDDGLKLCQLLQVAHIKATNHQPCHFALARLDKPQLRQGVEGLCSGVVEVNHDIHLVLDYP